MDGLLRELNHYITSASKVIARSRTAATLMELEPIRTQNGREKEVTLIMGLFGTQANTVNCLEEFKQHYRFFKMFNGGHRLTVENIRQVILPLVKEMTPNYFWETECFT